MIVALVIIGAVACAAFVLAGGAFIVAVQASRAALVARRPAVAPPVSPPPAEPEPPEPLWQRVDSFWKTFETMLRPTVTCAVCGQKNRLGLRRGGVRCGRCKRPLIQAIP